ncbi:MAG: restriction endonuclease [Boseongicola sp.]|nr:restriction endonuclease [Boseongicola sp.]
MAKPGKAYEEFVAGLHRALLEAERLVDGHNIEVELNKIIIDNDGLEREFDVYWEYEIAGIQYRTVIECKDYNSSVSVVEIDALLGKTQYIPGLRLVFATKKGYQSGAKTKAIRNNVDLLIVREQNESDWYAPDGTPLLKRIHIDIMYQMPTIIHSFSPAVDVDWMEEHTDIDTSKPLAISGLNSDIVIEDRSAGKIHSLLEISRDLQPIGALDTGRFTDTLNFEDAFIVHKEQRFKMKSCDIEYTIPEALKSTLEIDFSAQLDGVIEYLQSNVKATIFGDRVMRESTHLQDDDS